MVFSTPGQIAFIHTFVIDMKQSIDKYGESKTCSCLLVLDLAEHLLYRLPIFDFDATMAHFKVSTISTNTHVVPGESSDILRPIIYHN